MNTDILLNEVGVPYGWGHKGYNASGVPVKEHNGKLVEALYYGYDCSGFAAWVGEHLRSEPLRATWDAKRMEKELPEVRREDVRPFDLAVYPGHVMVVLAVSHAGRVVVIGASGGNFEVTTKEYAERVGAMVKVINRPDYRPDFIGFRRW